jgi:hypothetical protein
MVRPFESYYYNSGGDHALDAPKALIEIGASKLAKIVDEANQLFPKGLPNRDTGDRQDKMDDFGDDIYELWEEQDSKVFTREEPTEELLWLHFPKNKLNFKKC